MKINKMVILAALIVLACSGSEKETPNGFKFQVLKEGDGTVVKPGQYMVYHFVVMDSKDSVWADSFERGYPELAEIGDSLQAATEDGYGQMLRMLSKGDSVKFEMPVTEIFKEMAKRPVPPEIDSTLSIRYLISVEEILNKDQLAEFQSKVEQEYYANEEKKSQEQLGKDTVTINNYLESKGITATKLPSGMSYVITQEGSGPVAQSGQTVLVNYTGYLLDGTYFDSSVESIAIEKGVYDSLRAARYPYQPFEVTIDQSSVIQGWHLALKQMNKGAKGTFYIPSTLAYGRNRRSEKIKENEILIFDLEVLDIK